MPKNIGILLVFFLPLVIQAALIEIVPTSYVFDQATDVGSYTYHDETGRQLIDGIYGSSNWSDNLGNGNAYEWVGWCNDPVVNIDFDFSMAKGINVIKIGTTQDNLDDVVVPSYNLYSSDDKVTWTFIGNITNPESTANNYIHITSTFSNLNLNTRYIRVSAVFSYNGPWTFLDEVDFYQDTSIPEPSTFLLVLGVLLFGKKFFFSK